MQTPRLYLIASLIALAASSPNFAYALAKRGGGSLRRPQVGHVRVLEAVPLSEAISLIGPILRAVVRL